MVNIPFNLLARPTLRVTRGLDGRGPCVLCKARDRPARRVHALVGRPPGLPSVQVMPAGGAKRLRSGFTPVSYATYRRNHTTFPALRSIEAKGCLVLGSTTRTRRYSPSAAMYASRVRPSSSNGFGGPDALVFIYSNSHTSS